MNLIVYDKIIIFSRSGDVKHKIFLSCRKQAYYCRKMGSSNRKKTHFIQFVKKSFAFLESFVYHIERELKRLRKMFLIE